MFDWLFRKSNFQLFQDHYARTYDSMFAGLLEAITIRLEKGDTVFLLAHFQATFLELQERIEETEIEYSIMAEAIDFSVVERLSEVRPNRVHLSMTQMLASDSQVLESKGNTDVSVVVCERHPMPSYDQLINQWCRQLAFPVELGYLLSLDDPVVSHVISESVKQLLEQFGMGENELVTSSMVSRRLNSVLKRKAAKVVNEVKADSSREWLKLNYETSSDTNRS